ncbi:S24 family peptidase [Sphingobium sp. TomTYG45]
MSFDDDDDDWDQRKARNLIGCLVSSTGLSATEIARRAGLAPSTLTRIYPKASVGYSLSPRSVAKIREAFPQQIPFCEVETTQTGNALVSGSAGELPSASAIINRQQIPVYATTPLFPEDAQVPHVHELEAWECDPTRPATYMAAPYLVGEAQRYFAIYIPSEAMEPRFRAGERVILDRIKPASIGMDVLVRLREETRSPIWTIGRLQMRDRNLINLLQYRSNVCVSIHRSNINQIFPIIGMIDDAV